MSDNVLDSILPTLRPFPERYLYDYRVVAKLTCPTCLAVDNFYNPTNKAIFNAILCKGSLDPQCECGGDHFVTCAGIIEPHLHVGCQICKSTFLLHLPEKK